VNSFTLWPPYPLEKFQDFAVHGNSVAPMSELRTVIMLVLLIAGNYKLVRLPVVT